MFKNVTRITLSIVSDPEIEDMEKIKLNISIKEDIETMLRLDEEAFMAINDIILEKHQDYFVKTYEIVE